MKSEFILVTDQQDLRGNIHDSGLQLASLRTIRPETLFLMQRERAETDERFLQIIPYVAVIDNSGSILVYRRPTSAGEQRLAGKLSMGFGGHIDAQDVVFCKGSCVDLAKTVRACIRRELKEELNVDCYHFVGSRLVYFSDEPVDRVHIGALFVAILDEFQTREATTSAAENEIEVVGWIEPGDLKKINRPEYEKWSLALSQYLEMVLGE